MSIETLILIFVIHYVADFWFQSEKEALSKSSNNKSLAMHCLKYAIPFLIFGPVFAIVTGLLHFAVDYYTSRIAAHYHKTNQNRRFFQTIGCDQLMHMLCLVLTYKIIF